MFAIVTGGSSEFFQLCIKVVLGIKEKIEFFGEVGRGGGDGSATKMQLDLNRVSRGWLLGRSCCSFFATNILFVILLRDDRNVCPKTASPPLPKIVCDVTTPVISRWWRDIKRR